MIQINRYLKKTIALCLAFTLFTGVINSFPSIRKVEAKGNSTSTSFELPEGAVLGEDVVDTARQYINVTPYVYSGTDLRGGADCSGFCLAIYKLFGMDFSRYRATYDMMTNASKIGVNLGTDTNLIQPGDLVFTYGGEHMGIATSKATYVHMSSTRGCCVEDLFYSEVCMIIRPYNVYSRDNYVDVDKNIYLGVDYTPVYNYNYFVKNNAKIASSLGDASDVEAHKLACLKYFITNGMDKALRGSETFDVFSYYNKYKDLRDAYGKNYKKYYMHFVNFGYKEGRKGTGTNTLQNAQTVYAGVDYKTIYDYNVYTSNNPDVKNAFDGDEYKVLEHFVKNGMREGRKSINTFDLTSYKYANQDLRIAYRNDNEKYYRHYMNYGKNEGRKATGVTYITQPVTKLNGVDYSPVYDYNAYVKAYPDVARQYKNDDVAVLEYFINSGMAKGDKGNNTFDVNSYKNAYADLRSSYGSDLKKYYMHYINYGKSEGRNKINNINKVQNPITKYNGVDYKDVYDYDYYISKNADIKNAFGNDDIKTLEHFVKYGMNEGRASIASFDLKSYKNANADLRQAYKNDNARYYTHYMNYGKKEGRKATGVYEVVNPITTLNGVNYRDVYDYKYYISTYPEVARQFGNDDIAVLNYFVNTGMANGQRGNEAFDVYSYKNYYSDLRLAFGSDLKKYYMHYINSGKAEGRNKTSGVPDVKSPVTSLDGINYSAVYDFNYYLSKNPDLREAFGNDDIAVLRHFVTNGMNEGRKSKETFVLSVYKDSNPDLVAAYGDNNAKYYMHYINYGEAEGRKAY